MVKGGHCCTIFPINVGTFRPSTPHENVVEKRQERGRRAEWTFIFLVDASLSLHSPTPFPLLLLSGSQAGGPTSPPLLSMGQPGNGFAGKKFRNNRRKILLGLNFQSKPFFDANRCVNMISLDFDDLQLPAFNPCLLYCVPSFFLSC